MPLSTLNTDNYPFRGRRASYFFSDLMVRHGCSWTHMSGFRLCKADKHAAVIEVMRPMLPEHFTLAHKILSCSLELGRVYLVSTGPLFKTVGQQEVESVLF